MPLLSSCNHAYQKDEVSQGMSQAKPGKLKQYNNTTNKHIINIKLTFQMKIYAQKV